MMMGNNDKKGIVAMIVKKMGPNKESMEETEKNENGDEVESNGHDEAVEEMFDAIKTENKEKFKEALKSFIEICMSEYEDKEESEDGESEQE